MQTYLSSKNNSRTALRKQSISNRNKPLLPESVKLLPNDSPVWQAWLAYAEVRRDAQDGGAPS